MGTHPESAGLGPGLGFHNPPRQAMTPAVASEAMNSPAAIFFNMVCTSETAI